MELPKPGTSFWKNNKEFVVHQYDVKKHGTRSKIVVAHEVGCKDHQEDDWCIWMDQHAYFGQVEKGEICFEPRKHEIGADGSEGSGGPPEGEAPPV